MKKLGYVALAGFALVLLCGGFILSTYNTLVGDEEGIRAQEKMIDLSIDKMVKKIESGGHVVANFKETLLEVLGKTIGEGGRAASAGAVFNAVAEQYPSVPQDLWRDLAATMNSEYESVAASQASKVSRLQAYRTRLRNPVYFLAEGLGGFPTISLEEADKLILGGKARDARQTGTIETIDPFAKPEKK
jgi:hypothetical protein